MGVLARRVASVAAVLAAVIVASASSAATASASPAPGTLRLDVPDAFVVSHALVTVPGRMFHIQGVLRPYVPGQMVLVRAFIGHRLFKTAQLAVTPARGGAYGTFVEALSSTTPGDVTIKVGHHPTTALVGLFASRRVAVLDEHVGFGSSGPFMALIQQRLAALHFYIPQTGAFDEGTALALDAYHRLLRWGTSQTLDGRTISFLLDGFGAYPVHYPKNGKHAEGDLTLQLLALVDGSKVMAIYPISSGKPSTPTILGNFRVYSKVPGYLPDGMYFSNFFYSGYAIHGYNPAPDYPASHGCMRLPIVDAISVYDWLQIGDWVDVYY
jgi:L,D-transpeptidase catalytic domain